MLVHDANLYFSKYLLKEVKLLQLKVRNNVKRKHQVGLENKYTKRCSPCTTLRRVLPSRRNSSFPALICWAPVVTQACTVPRSDPQLMLCGVH